MKKQILAFALVVFSLTACNKDQQVINQLNGTWKLSKIEINDKDETADYEGTEYNFEQCRVRKDDQCEGSLKVIKVGSPVSKSFSYVVSDDGEKITLTSTDANTGTDVESGDIKDSSNKEMKFELKDNRGNKKTLKLDKIKP